MREWRVTIAYSGVVFGVDEEDAIEQAKFMVAAEEAETKISIEEVHP
jgi:hypothetical protein